VATLEALWLQLHARALVLFGRLADADQVFTRLMALTPDSAYPLASRAHVRAQLGQRDAAIADYQRLTQQHPRAAAAHWYNLGFLLEQAGRVDEAGNAFRQALALNEKLDTAWYGLGLVLIQQQRYDEAVAALKRNTELQPMSPFGWYQLARVHLDRQEPDETRRIIRHLKQFEPKVAAQLERETGLSA
jgi:tetratricopeptide (TPR) repeat protein